MELCHRDRRSLVMDDEEVVELLEASTTVVVVVPARASAEMGRLGNDLMGKEPLVLTKHFRLITLGLLQCGSNAER